MITKRKGALPLLAMMLGLGITLIGGPAHADTINTAQIKNYHGNQKCLDVRTEDHRTVQLWSCANKPQKTWTIFFFDRDRPQIWKFRNNLDNKCLEAPTLSGGPGEVVTVEDCRPSASQEWKVFFAMNGDVGGRGWFQVWQNQNTFTCLYLPGNQSTNGVRIETRACNAEDPGQHWQMVGGPSTPIPD
jgi:hypothetical protein